MGACCSSKIPPIEVDVSQNCNGMSCCLGTREKVAELTVLPVSPAATHRRDSPIPRDFVCTIQDVHTETNTRTITQSPTQSMRRAPIMQDEIGKVNFIYTVDDVTFDLNCS